MPSDRFENPRGTPESSKGGQDREMQGRRPDVESPSAGTNGRRLGLQELNLGVDNGCDRHNGMWQRFLRGLSQFLAGMYTGESCAGTPHGERKSDTAGRDTGDRNHKDTKK